MHILCDGIPILTIVVLFVLPLLKRWKVFFLRKLGLFPKKGYETIADVEMFMKNKRRDLAIICYRLIYTESSLKNAVEEVDKFRINIK